MDRIDANILSRVPPIHVFNPTAPPVVVDSIDLKSGAAKPSTWTKYSPTLTHISRQTASRLLLPCIGKVRLTRLRFLWWCTSAGMNLFMTLPG